MSFLIFDEISRNHSLGMNLTSIFVMSFLFVIQENREIFTIQIQIINDLRSSKKKTQFNMLIANQPFLQIRQLFTNLTYHTFIISKL